MNENLVPAMYGIIAAIILVWVFVEIHLSEIERILRGIVIRKGRIDFKYNLDTSGTPSASPDVPDEDWDWGEDEKGEKEADDDDDEEDAKVAFGEI